MESVPTSKKPRKPKSETKTANAKRAAADVVPLPNRRAMEAVLSQLGGRRADALDAAQDLIYSAWDTTDRRRRISLARKALGLSPNCADAYVLLAEETANTPAEAIDLYRQGVEAGEKALGKAAFKNDVGHFWGIFETRPYMRARSGLAQALWASGQHEEAIDQYRELLRLNPNDNQGNRYLLAACLLALDRDKELKALLDTYGPEHSAYWSYTTALVAFREGGDTADARTCLADALKINKHVPLYLLGKRKLPPRPSSYITMGGEDEAQEYVRSCGPSWRRTTGALEWLERNAS